MRHAPGKRRSTGGLTRVAPLVLLCAWWVAPPLLPPLLWPAPAGAQQPRPLPAPAADARRVAALGDYRARVREAAALLEGLASAHELVTKSESYEVWSREGFNSDFVAELPEREKADLARALSLLPQKERVEWGGSFVEADNAWLHQELGEGGPQGEHEKRAAALRAAAGRLRALEARLAEAEGAAAEAFDADAERGRLNAILSAPEFSREARHQGGALRRLVNDFVERLLALLPDFPRLSPGASPQASLATQLVVLALCLAVIAYVARRLWLRRAQGVRPLKLKRGARVVLGERLEADQTASDLLEEAERLARAGELRGAIRKAYVALLCELGDRGVVRLERHKTNRDYLGAVRRAAPPGLYAEMLPLTFDFEVHWYGLRDASDADWQSFAARCRRILSSR